MRHIYQKDSTHSYEFNQGGFSCTVGSNNTDPTVITQNTQKQVTVLIQDISDLESDKAQLTLKRLGVLLPGYVNVQFESFNIARVLLLTPIREPGGGNENLIVVAAKV